MRDWRPISTYPESKYNELGQHVICAHREHRWIRFGRKYMDRWYYSGTNERSQWTQVEGDEPTHWQPIPELPISGE